jgi:ABC-2 type transport system ATP-binding protein
MIELHDFGVAFDGFSLGPFSVTIAAGERVALVGANGAGKSTTLRAVSGLLTGGYSGSVRVHGREVATVGPHIRWKVGLLPERLPGFGWMTVTEHLDFLGAFHPTWDSVYAAELTERLQLRRDAKLANLSKGMQVRLSLVAVESYRPLVLLLDEPTSGIDPLMRHDLLALLRACVPEGGGRTILFSSHILEDVDAVSDRVLLLRDGDLIGDVTVEELRTCSGGAPISEELVRRLRLS